MNCMGPIFLFSGPKTTGLSRSQQAHKPIIEQETIEGHSVRAMYLLTAITDLLRMDTSVNRDLDIEAKRNAVARLWNNMVQRKMYSTGGIGALKQWEGLGIDYSLSSGADEGGWYSETCTAIGVERLLQVWTLSIHPALHNHSIYPNHTTLHH